MQSDQDTAQIDGLVLALDIGGSFIKAGLVNTAGLATEFAPFPVDAAAAAPSVIRAFAEVIHAGLRVAGRRIDAVGIAAPGPFDYARGVSLMKHKFAALAGIGLADALREALPGLAGTPVLFRHDAHAFLAGERWLGAAQGAARALGVTLGTGIGVSCCVDGAFVNNALGGPASEVSVWNRPYKGGVVEDAVSVRGLVARYRRMRPDYPAANGVKGIAEAAEAGDAGARAVFAGLGADLAEVLLPLCGRFAPERIVFGGQIAGSFALFENELKAGLARAAPPPGAAAGALGTRAALFGVAREGMGLSHG